MAEGRKSMETALAIIGGGPAGLAAALAAREAGVEDILILERDSGPWRDPEPVYPQRFWSPYLQGRAYRTGIRLPLHQTGGRSRNPLPY